MPIPAVTLQESTVHNNQNWRVLIASAAETSCSVIIGFAATVAGSKPSGFQPGGGTRMLATPIIMIRK